MTTITTVPFSKLVATDEINARAATKDGIDELAASIAQRGLIQPLAVRPVRGCGSASEAQSKDGGKYEVIDGRRRHAALAKLVKAKTLKKDHDVPVLVRNEDDAEALETSLVANTVRLPMHPVDQFAVFARLSEQGKTDADIAARFGITERVVRQQKALGNLAPPIRDAWRKGTIEAAAAKAFTLHPSLEVQAAAYEKLRKTWGRSPIPEHAVRGELVGRRVAAHTINDAVMQRYVAAGGTVSEDLFSEESYCDDAALVETVTRDWAEAECADLKQRFLAGGWSWVARERELQDRGSATWRLDTIDTEEGATEERGYRVDNDERDEIEARFSAEEKARSGVVIYLYTNGQIEFQFGVLLPDDQTDIEDAIDAAGASKMEACPDCGGVDSGDCDTCGGEGEIAAEDDLPSVSEVIGGEDDGEAGDAPFAITGALTERVTTALTHSAAAALATAPMTALRVMLAGLTVASYSTPAKIAVTRFGARGVGAAAERDFDGELARAMRITDEAVIADLAGLVAQSLNLVRHQHYHDRKRAGAAHSQDIAALLAVLPAATFNDEARRAFDAADYFKSATKATALAAIEEIREAGAAIGLAPEDVLADMRKADLAKAAADAALACGWLPPELRNGAYALTTPEAGAQRLTGKQAAAEQSSEAEAA